MDALARHAEGRKVCVVFDEFQDILDVADGEQLFALMRARIQALPRTSFVFLGSARNAMLSIFLSPKSPFYKSATVFDVGAIPDNDFFRFAKGRFAAGGRVRGFRQAAHGHPAARPARPCRTGRRTRPVRRVPEEGRRDDPDDGQALARRAGEGGSDLRPCRRTQVREPVLPRVGAAPPVNADGADGALFLLAPERTSV